VAVIGTGPIGLMFIDLAHRRGAHVIAVGRRAERLDARARWVPTSWWWAKGRGPGRDDSARDKGRPRRGSRHRSAGQPETTQAAVRTARKGGTSICSRAARLERRFAVDAQSLHYEEVTITSTFHHHAGQHPRRRLDLIARGVIDPERYITGEAPLTGVADCLERMGEGRQLKTLIRPELD